MWALTACAAFGVVASLRLLLPREAVQSARHPVIAIGGILVVAATALANSWIANVWLLALVWAAHRSFRRQRGFSECDR